MEILCITLVLLIIILILFLVALKQNVNTYKNLFFEERKNNIMYLNIINELSNTKKDLENELLFKDKKQKDS